MRRRYQVRRWRQEGVADERRLPAVATVKARVAAAVSSDKGLIGHPDLPAAPACTRAGGHGQRASP